MKYKSKDKEKICNLCGDLTLNYIIKDNAPLCTKCMPVKEMKKLMNESTMLQKILAK